MRFAALFCLFILASFSFASIEWVFPSPQSLSPQVVPFQGNMVVASEDGTVYSLSPNGGEISWSYDAKEGIPLSPCAADASNVVVATSSGKIIMLGSAGKLQKEIDFGKKPLQMACSSGRVFVSSLDEIAAYSVLGAKIWNATLLGVPGAIAAYPRTVYLTSDKKLFSFSALDGRLNWEAKAEDSFLSAPAESEDSVYLGASNGRLYAFKKSDGKPRFSYFAGGWIVSSPVVDGSRIYFGSTDGSLYAITDYANDVFEFKAGSAIWSTPLLHNSSTGKIIVFGTDKGTVFGIDSESGRESWSFSTSGRINSPIEKSGNFIFTTSFKRAMAISSSPICSFSYPLEGQIVGPWPIEVIGKAYSDATLLGVEVRAGTGSFAAAEGSGSFKIDLDMSGEPEGTVKIECRARDASGAFESGEYSSVNVVKMQNAPRQVMQLSAPKSAKSGQQIEVIASSSDGKALRGITVLIGDQSESGDSPLKIIASGVGATKVTVSKLGFQDGIVYVNLSSEGLPIMVIAGALVLIVVAFFAYKKFFSKKAK